MKSLPLKCVTLFLLGATMAVAKPPTMDLPAVDRVLAEVAKHALNYPPRFSSAAERSAVEGRLRRVIQVMDTAADAHPDDAGLQLRDGFANALGTNLDFKGSPARCAMVYLRLLKQEPDNPAANFQYGAFLGSTNHPKESLPYLQKAASLGVTQAHWGLAITHLQLKDVAGAIRELKTYVTLRPDDPNAKRFLKSLEDPKLKIQTATTKPTGR